MAKNNRLLERAEIYEGIARTLRNGLASRGAPRNDRARRNIERLERQAEEAERRAETLRVAAGVIERSEV